MGRARGHGLAAAAVDPFAVALGGRRGALSEPDLLSRRVSSAKRMAAVEAELAGDLKDNLQKLHRHADELGSAPGVDLLARKVAERAVAPERERTLQQAPPVLAMLGAGVTVAQHVVRSGHILHLAPNGLTGGASGSMWASEPEETHCGGVLSAKPVLTGSWSAATDTEPPSKMEYSPQLGRDVKAYLGYQRCAECARFSEAYPESESEAETAEQALPDEYLEVAQQSAEGQVLEHLRRWSHGARPPSESRVRETALDSYRRGLEEALGMYFADHPRRLDGLLGAAHVRAYRRKLRRTGIGADEAQQRLTRFAEQKLFSDFARMYFGPTSLGEQSTPDILQGLRAFRTRAHRRLEEFQP